MDPKTCFVWQDTFVLPFSFLHSALQIGTNTPLAKPDKNTEDNRYPVAVQLAEKVVEPPSVTRAVSDETVFKV